MAQAKANSQPTKVAKPTSTSRVTIKDLAIGLTRQQNALDRIAQLLEASILQQQGGNIVPVQQVPVQQEIAHSGSFSFGGAVVAKPTIKQQDTGEFRVDWNKAKTEIRQNGHTFRPLNCVMAYLYSEYGTGKTVKVKRPSDTVLMSWDENGNFSAKVSDGRTFNGVIPRKWAEEHRKGVWTDPDASRRQQYLTELENRCEIVK